LIHNSEIKIAQFTFNCFSIDIRKCEQIDHTNVFFRTGPRATYMVLAGDLVPAGTALVTLDLEGVYHVFSCWNYWKDNVELSVCSTEEHRVMLDNSSSQK